MDQNIPLQNINQNLNLEETAERRNNLAREVSKFEDKMAVCGIISVTVAFCLLIAYYIGVESCKRSRDDY